MSSGFMLSVFTLSAFSSGVTTLDTSALVETNTGNLIITEPSAWLNNNCTPGIKDVTCSLILLNSS